MPIEIIRKKVSLAKVGELAKSSYGDMVKGVVDLRRKVIALGGELHADAEALLLQDGARQDDLWGFNLFPDRPKEEWIQYTSFINIRPAHGNRSQEIQDEKLKKAIREIIEALIDAK